MNSDKYVLSAIALIQSIQKHFQPDFVLFVNNISERAILALKSLNNTTVIQVELIDFPVNADIWPRFKHNYTWLSTCFTKFYAFSLTNYQKVLFLDSDMLCLQNFEKLFQLATPAGCLVSRQKAGFQSGVLLTPLETILALQSGYGISGACFLISPRENEFNELMNRLAQQVQKFQHYKEDFATMCDQIQINSHFSPQDQQQLSKIVFNAGPDEQLLTHHYFGKWVNISRQFCCVPWLVGKFQAGQFKINYLKGTNQEGSYRISDSLDFDGQYDKEQRRKVYLIHYVAEKPWEKIGQKMWPDCKLFFDQLACFEDQQFVRDVFGDVSAFEYVSQQEADHVWENDFRRKFDK